jgi:hypothetical protein
MFVTAPQEPAVIVIPVACDKSGIMAARAAESPRAGDAEEWQAAMEALLLVVEHGGPTMLARIGIMRALNRNAVREFNPDRKDTHWGRRKLKRDL